jgi:hypothetical protein
MSSMGSKPTNREWFERLSKLQNLDWLWKRDNICYATSLNQQSKRKIWKRSQHLKDYGMPVTSWFKIVRPMDDTEKIDGNLQSKYCSGVGMLLYLIKYSRPDLENVVREWS